MIAGTTVPVAVDYLTGVRQSGRPTPALARQAAYLRATGKRMIEASVGVATGQGFLRKHLLPQTPVAEE